MNLMYRASHNPGYSHNPMTRLEDIRIIRAIPLPVVPTLQPNDVTVIIPTCLTIDLQLFKSRVKAIQACRPAKIIIVTVDDQLKLAKASMGFFLVPNLVVLGIPKLNKRQQMVEALRKVTTKIVVFADDDVLWPNEDYLCYLLACFEDPGVGAAGTRQRVRRENWLNFWNFLAVCYLERRNLNKGATSNIDGAISTLSGRTAAYRTAVIRNDKFYQAFLGDQYNGKVLDSDDDKFLTRWTYSNNWKIAIQSDERAVLETTMQFNRSYVHGFINIWALFTLDEIPFYTYIPCRDRA
ncbi:MAG: hypothetical protein Q9165_004082 [Trypethelium subeluteriae]